MRAGCVCVNVCVRMFVRVACLCVRARVCLSLCVPRLKAHIDRHSSTDIVRRARVRR